MSSNQVLVKICGLRDAQSAGVAIEAGADALGFILAPSRRQVTPDAIRAIRDQIATSAGETPTTVGVVVNGSAGEIESLAARSGIDMVQLSGDEDVAILQDLGVPAIKALRFDAGTPLDEARREVNRWLSASSPARYVIVEGHAAGSYGGAGAVADWVLAAAIAEEFPILLAGGLNPANVGPAIEQVHPAGVDVSSGIETDGAKDHAKIRAFVAAAQSGVS